MHFSRLNYCFDKAIFSVWVCGRIGILEELFCKFGGEHILEVGQQQEVLISRSPSSRMYTFTLRKVEKVGRNRRKKFK